MSLTASPAGARITYNTIDATAALVGDGHVVRAIVFLGCTAGEQVEFTLTLTQEGASGTGHGAGVCTGEPMAYEVTVPAERGAFLAGVPQACATAVNRDLCTADPTAYEVTAQGGTFTAGAAEACATAINRDRGVVVDTRQWCRAAGVTLSAG